MSDFPTEHRLLVARARLGDREAFGRLVRAYTPRLLAFLRGVGADGPAAEDAVQDAWLAAWSSLGRLRDVAAFRGWLYGIARRRALRLLGPLREVTGADVDVPCGPPDDGPFDTHLPNLGAAMGRVSVAHREVLALRFLEGLSYDELVGALGVSVGTVKSRLHHAKAALRRALEELSDD